MDEATARRRLAASSFAVLATVTPAGRPHAVPCCFALGGERIWTAVDDVKPKSTPALRRLANVSAVPAAALLADHRDDDWSRLWWVRVDGTARVVTGGDEREQAVAALAAKYPQYAASPPPGPALVLEDLTWRWWPRSG